MEQRIQEDFSSEKSSSMKTQAELNQRVQELEEVNEQNRQLSKSLEQQQVRLLRSFQPRVSRHAQEILRQGPLRTASTARPGGGGDVGMRMRMRMTRISRSDNAAEQEIKIVIILAECRGAGNGFKHGEQKQSKRGHRESSDCS
eukprot:758517-Hanusia_phi.AAC.2